VLLANFYFLVQKVGSQLEEWALVAADKALVETAAQTQPARPMRSSSSAA
jgi:hypothetical protein